ncbi:hypothetical protein [Vibrio sonorensis]|uniref:hypothetical protein n=1 Tax=Vibrio sonorensis TaxID=1004316 RepID=UPI0015868869|nr:hypothetical protein [Vibrio sonorensis]
MKIDSVKKVLMLSFTSTLLAGCWGEKGKPQDIFTNLSANSNNSRVKAILLAPVLKL